MCFYGDVKTEGESFCYSFSEPQKSDETDETNHVDTSDQVGITEKRLKMTPRTDLLKHRKNIQEILQNSNATPIRRYGGIGYTCCYCKKQFEDPAELKKHTLATHKNIPEANFMKKMNMSEYVVKLDVTALECKLCNSVMDNLNIFVDHLQKEHEKKINMDYMTHIFPFKFGGEMRCCICSQTFSKFRTLVVHMHIHYRNYICTICDAGFVNRNSLTQHSEMHKIGKYICDFCPKVFTTQVKKRVHIRTAHTHVHGTYKCAYCKETFKEYEQRQQHISSAHGVVVTTACQACNKVFNGRKTLNIHIRRDHLMERPHKCTECDMTFLTKAALQNHIVKHTGSKEFKCTICLKYYGRKKTLDAHMRTHDKVKKYKCEHCGQNFAQKCSWKGHMKSKHGEIV